MIKGKYKSLVKNIGLFTLGSFGSKLFSFLLVPLYTAILSTGDYGRLDVLITTVSLITPIILLSIQDAVLRFVFDDKYNNKDVLSSALHILGKSSVLLICCLIIAYWLGIFRISVYECVFFELYFIVGALNSIFTLYLKGRDKASIIAISGIISTIVTCVMNILTLLVFKWGINGYMMSMVLGLIVANIYQMIMGDIISDVTFKQNRIVTLEMIKYSLPLISNSIAWWINSASDRYILTYFKGVHENGIYSMAYKIPNILAIFCNIFYNAWSISAIVEFDENDSDAFIGNNYTIYSVLSVIVCSSLILLNKPMSRFLYSGDFYEAWLCIPFLLVGSIFNSLATFEGSIYAATKKTKLVSLTTITGAGINIILNFILIPMIGAVGAAIATMIGYLIMWLLRTIFVLRMIKMRVKWFNHISTCILVIIQAYIATYMNSIILQVIVVVMLILVNRYLIVRLFRKFNEIIKTNRR